MIYSVYNYNRRSYDYYEGPGPSGTHAEAPSRPLLAGPSSSPEKATWSLPIGAKKIGMGDMPKGRIASAPSLAGFGDYSLSSKAVALTVGVIAAVFLAGRRRK